MNQTRHVDQAWHVDTAGHCGLFPSLGEIGLQIVATATRNLALTGLRTARGSRPQGEDAPVPRSH